MGRKKAKLSSKEADVMNTLFLNSGTYYKEKVLTHLGNAAGKVPHKIKEITPEEFYKSMRNDPDAGKKVDGAEFTKQQLVEYIGNLDYIVSSGSSKNRKYDTKIHEFIKDHKRDDAVFLGICHGAQQMALAHKATLTKGKEAIRGKRKSKIMKYDEDLMGIESGEGDITSGKQIYDFGHHWHYMNTKDIGSDLEILAQVKHEKGHQDQGKSFVEMYRVKDKYIYGTQTHPERGDGQLIKNLFGKAYENKTGVKLDLKTGPKKAEEVVK